MGDVYAISIHAPPRGATLLALTCLPMAFYFNSRPSARGDTGLNAEQIYYFISIHAPPRGATKVKAGTTAPAAFQFTPLREGRRNRLPFPPAE